MSIVGDAGIATVGLGEGRMIPLVIVDTTDRPDVEEYIRLHTFIATGDVKCTWCQLVGRPDSVGLILSFVKPAELVSVIEFDLSRNHGILVEQILVSRGLYVQAGRVGDRLKHDINRPKLILEIPDTGFRSKWNRIFERFAVKRMRANGLARPDAKRAAQSFVGDIRKVAAFKMKT